MIWAIFKPIPSHIELGTWYVCKLNEQIWVDSWLLYGLLLSYMKGGHLYRGMGSY